MYPHRHPGADHRFDLLPDGLLGITVLGVEQVRITDLWQEGTVCGSAGWSPLPLAERRLGRISTPWPRRCRTCSTTIPSTRPSIPEPDWEDASWVAQRWLEVLPIPVEQKQWLVAARTTSPPSPLLSGLLVASHLVSRCDPFPSLSPYWVRRPRHARDGAMATIGSTQDIAPMDNPDGDLTSLLIRVAEQT